MTERKRSKRRAFVCCVHSFFPALSPVFRLRIPGRQRRLPLMMYIFSRLLRKALRPKTLPMPLHMQRALILTWSLAHTTTIATPLMLFSAQMKFRVCLRKWNWIL